jgi:hypothetical protein
VGHELEWQRAQQQGVDPRVKLVGYPVMDRNPVAAKTSACFQSSNGPRTIFVLGKMKQEVAFSTFIDTNKSDIIITSGLNSLNHYRGRGPSKLEPKAAVIILGRGDDQRTCSHSHEGI